ncbi:GntR family transcriptional regulator [Bartonella sp. LJL80]
MANIETTGQGESLSDLAYKKLERLMVTLFFEPGSIINERDVIEATGMGRTPVREAIQRFAWEGFFVIHPRSGIAVTPLEPQDFSRVLDAREGVEMVLARDAARFAGSHDHHKMELVAQALQQSAKDEDPYAFLDADKMLDEVIGKAAGNIFAARFAEPLQTHSRRFWFRFRRGAEGIRTSADRHCALIEAVISGDRDKASERAKELMRYLVTMTEY